MSSIAATAAAGFGSKKKLKSLAGDRDNNFNLLRLIAAFLVLFSHCYAISTGLSSEEPLRSRLGVTPGSIAVDIFFVTSGFLVTRSLLSGKSFGNFVRARILRIFPGLVVAVSMTVFVLGPLLTTLPADQYLANRDTILYFLRNSTLVSGVSFTLPGVFETNPLKYGVNFPLWSLPYEIGMYAGLAALWILLAPQRPKYTVRFRRAVFAIAIFSLVAHIVSHFVWRDSALLRLTAMFAIGASFFLLRDRIALSPKRFAACAIFVLISTFNEHFFFFSYTLLLPFLVFCFAYIPRGAIRRYNRVGDYSYGVYIYAFPIQQSIAYLIPGVGVGKMLVLSTALTAMCAILSWHLIESRALKYK